MAAAREKLLSGKRVCLFCDFQFEDMEVMFPKIRLEEEGATVVVVGAHDAGTKYTGKYGCACRKDPDGTHSLRIAHARTRGHTHACASRTHARRTAVQIQ